MGSLAFPVHQPDWAGSLSFASLRLSARPASSAAAGNPLVWKLTRITRPLTLRWALSVVQTISGAVKLLVCHYLIPLSSSEGLLIILNPTLHLLFPSHFWTTD